jgi:asparagine synthase (glutamine-hydrolysing)
MNGIYGVCEPGVKLLPLETEPMSLMMGIKEQLAESRIGGNGALLGVAGDVNVTSLAAAYGSLVAIDADLCNYGALLREHEKSHGNGGTSVAEMVAGLYVRHGMDCAEKLEGAFSLALWDPQLQRLLLAVDRHSFKTLYWSFDDGRLLFAGRLSAIEVMKRRTEVDPAALMQFLVHTVVPAPLTIYKGIERLEPGTQLVYQKGQIKKARYWNLRYEESGAFDVREWRDELRECMRQAVHRHLDGCHPERTGAYLSGGTDSSSVVAFASEWYSPFNTFSIYFENPRYDEIGFARTAAQHFGARYHEKCLHASDAAEAIPKILEYYEEPFANSSAIGAYHCAQLARESGVDVLLAGDGGDELFAGNERYATDRKFALYQWAPEGLRSRVIKPAVGYLPQTGVLSLPARYIRRAEVSNPRRMFSYNFFLDDDGLAALSPDFLSEAKPEAALDIAQAHFDAAPHARSELNRLLYLDVKMTLSDNDIRKVMGTAEMAGVRVRFPLLDRRLVELSGRIPSNLKLRGFTKRYIFKEAMKSILPNKILYKKKHGFGVPLGYWLMNDPNLKSLAAILDEPQTRQRGYFRPDFLSRIKELNRVHPAYFGEVLWFVLVLELWHRRSRSHLAGESNALRVGVARAR